MRNLIVSADDFGLTRSVTDGVTKARIDGIVTNINFLATGEAFEYAARILRETGLKDIGGHLALTDGVPVSDPSRIKSLVTRDGKFNANYRRFFLKFALGLIDRDEIYIELKAQMERLKGAGVNMTNLNSHQHIHMIPGVLNIFVRLAKEYNIPSMRYTCGKEPAFGRMAFGKIYKLMVASRFRKRMKRILDEGGIRYTKSFAGFLDSGRLTEDALCGILTRLDDGATELMTHPGFLGPEVLDRYRWHLNCEYELYALTSPRAKKIIQERSIQLITYRELLAGGSG